MSDTESSTPTPAASAASAPDAASALDLDTYGGFFNVVTAFYPEFLRVFPECEAAIHPGVEKIVLYASELNAAEGEGDPPEGADPREVLTTDADVRHVVGHASERMCRLLAYVGSADGAEVFGAGADASGGGALDAELLPGIDFRECWQKEGVTDTTRASLWRYVQAMTWSLILTFTTEAFTAAHGEDAAAGLEGMMRSMMEGFATDVSGAGFGAGDGAGGAMDFSGVNMGAMPTPEDMERQFGGLLKGKLGRMAAEIASETADDLAGALGVDIASMSSPDQMLGALMKNPGKMMGMLKKIEGKLKEKMERDDISEADMMKEAMEMMTSMGSMPGMPGMGDIMSSMMGGGGGGGGMAGLAKMFGGAPPASREELRRKLREVEEAAGPAQKSSAADRERYLAQLAAAGGGAGKKRTNNKKKGKGKKKGKKAAKGK